MRQLRVWQRLGQLEDARHVLVGVVVGQTVLAEAARAKREDALLGVHHANGAWRT